MPASPRRPAPSRPEDVQVADSLRRLVRVLLRGAHEAEKRTGMSGAQLFVLQQLGDGRARSMREIAGLTLTHQSTVSVVVGRLVAKGLVARDRDTADRRRVMLTLTAAGRTALRRAPEPVQARLVATLARLPRRDLRQLARSLAVVVRAMGAGEGRVEMFLESAS